MIFRTLLHGLISARRPKLGHYDVGETAFVVLPTDLDVFRHMNNGVYLSILDIGRWDLLRRSGVWAIITARGWYPVIASETITFRKSLELWQRFTVESRMLGFDEKAVYMEQRFVRNNEVDAQAFIRARFLKRSGGTVPVSEIAAAVGGAPVPSDIPRWLRNWSEDVALPSTRAHAPSTWDQA